MTIERPVPKQPLFGKDPQLNAYLQILGIDSNTISEIVNRLNMIDENNRLGIIFKIGTTILFNWEIEGMESYIRFYGAQVDYITPKRHGTGEPIAGVRLQWTNGGYICLDVTGQYPLLKLETTLEAVITDDVFIIGHMHYLSDSEGNSKRSIWLNGFETITEPVV